MIMFILIRKGKNMSKIVGKVNRNIEKLNDYRRIVETNHKLFEIEIDNLILIEFNSDTLLEEDDLFYISDFTNQSYCLEILKSPLSTANFNELDRNEMKELHYILIDNNKYVYIQKITPSFIEKKRFLYFTEKFKIADNVKMISLKEHPDAVFDKEADKLYFKRLDILNSIFKGIENLFREATSEEVKSFIDYGFVEFSGDYTIEKIKASNRKRILSINNVIENLNDSKIERLLKYTSKYKTEIPYKNGKFSVSNEKELKNLIYGLQERYYTTEVGGEDRIANSVKILD